MTGQTACGEGMRKVFLTYSMLARVSAMMSFDGEDVSRTSPAAVADVNSDCAIRGHSIFPPGRTGACRVLHVDLIDARAEFLRLGVDVL